MIERALASTGKVCEPSTVASVHVSEQCKRERTRMKTKERVKNKFW